MKYCACKEIDQLVNSLVRDGWVYRRGGKHGRLVTPNAHETLSVPRTPSDYRAFLNFRRDVRQALAA
jgi:hypothetical protein